jgi:uncharacterized alpha-E superfamily protein
MLGRTAESLFWMSRQMERAENMARPGGGGLSHLAHADTGDGHREEWRSTLTSAGVLNIFLDKYGDASFNKAIGFLLFDDDNPSSVRSCLQAARTNARSVRSKITRDMWEALNSTWLAYDAINPADITTARLPELLDWIRERTPCSAVRCSAPSCATTRISSASSAPLSNAPTIRRASST